MTARPTHRTCRALAPLVLGCLALLLTTLYAPALDGPMVFDDITNIPQTHIDEFDLARVWSIATGNDSGTFGRPIPVASFALNHLLGDGELSRFKVVNLVLHAANAVLVYWFCLLLSSRLDSGRTRAGAASRVVCASPDVRAVALFAAVVWAIHPLQVSTVMYVVQRMTMMMTGFTLLALILYLRMRTAQIAGARRPPLQVPAIVLCTALAMLCKENGALVLLYVPLLEWLLFGFAMPGARERVRFLVVFNLLVTGPLLLGGLYAAANAGDLLASYAIRDFDLLERLLTEPAALLLYAKLILLPNVADMTFYHDAIAVSRELDARAVAGLAAVTAAALLVPVLARRVPVVSLGIGLFLVSHLLESTLLPLELVFEHRNYLGMLGLVLPLCWFGLVLARRVERPATAAIPALVVLALLSLQTYGRAHEWSSDISLNAFAVANGPESPRARTTLAVVLSNRGRPAEALEQLDAAARLRPDDPYAPLLRLQVLALNGIVDERAKGRALQVLGNGVVTSDAANVLVSIHDRLRAGAPGALAADTVLTLYDAAVANDRRRLASNEVAVLHTFRAGLLVDAGRSAEAEGALREAVLANPDNVEMQTLLLERLIDDARFDDAREQMKVLVALMSPAERASSDRVRAASGRLSEPPEATAEAVER